MLLRTIIDFVKERLQTHPFTHVVDLSPYADGKTPLPQRPASEQWLYVIKDTSWQWLTQHVLNKLNGVLLILSPPRIYSNPPEGGTPKPMVFVTKFEDGKLKRMPHSNIWNVAHTFQPKIQQQPSTAQIFRYHNQRLVCTDQQHHYNATDDMLCAYIATYLGVHLVTRDDDLQKKKEAYAKEEGPLFDLLVNAHCHVLTCTESQHNTNTLFHYINTFIPSPPASMSEFPFVHQEDKNIRIIDPIDLIVELE